MNPSVASWRRQQRVELIARRAALTSAERKKAADDVAEKLDRLVDELGSTVIGLYWPIKNELNLIHWARALARRTGAVLCLPVVVAPKSPLEYWRWAPGEAMQAGIWGIATPARREVCLPDLMLAPLVGFDAGNYRLGYGGGYFDRTLAIRPAFAVGVGYDFCGLETIFPQPHDVPMHAILTECREIRPSRG
jgi:5-formyltetrahydrofolate cyclo-ligase